MFNLNKDALPFLSIAQIEDLERFLAEKPKSFMAHELAIRLNIEWAKSISTISVLWAKRLSDVLLLVYHECDFSIPLEAKKYGEGLPVLPWDCPNCETRVTNYSELNFDLLAKPIYSYAM